MNEDPLEEAQEDIQPPNQLTQKKEDIFSSIHAEKEIPLLTEEEIDQILNKKLASKIFYKTNTFAHSSTELCGTDLESSPVN